MSMEVPVSAPEARPSRLGLRIAALSFGALGLAGVAGVGAGEGRSHEVAVAEGNGGDYEEEHKIWICHGVNGEGENKNGWNLIEVDASAADGEGENDHTQHVRKDGEADIIPAPGGENPYCPTDEDEETTTTTTQPEEEASVSVSFACEDGTAMYIDVTPDSTSY